MIITIVPLFYQLPNKTIKNVYINIAGSQSILVTIMVTYICQILTINVFHAFV